MVREMKEGIMEDDRKGTWEDVTEECGTRPASDDSCLYVCHPGLGYVRALLGKHGIYGHCVEGGAAGDSPNARGYRLARPTADTWAIEHFIPDPEPVIAYKAVIEKDGEWVSTFASADQTPTKDYPGGQRSQRLTYTIGCVTESTHGPGIYCYPRLRDAKRMYPSGDGRPIERNVGRLAILEVEATGLGQITNLITVCYPSVKVLSVAWEEEKKEEWVDVTDECVAEVNARRVSLMHNGICVALMGHQVNTGCGTLAKDYRVTTIPSAHNTFSGFLKVEKRNG